MTPFLGCGAVAPLFVSFRPGAACTIPYRGVAGAAGSALVAGAAGAAVAAGLVSLLLLFVVWGCGAPLRVFPPPGLIVPNLAIFGPFLLGCDPGL